MDVVYRTYRRDKISTGALVNQRMQILYKVATVFPTPGVMQNESPAPTYTFAAGSYEYPFEFKVKSLFYGNQNTFNALLVPLQ